MGHATCRLAALALAALAAGCGDGHLLSLDGGADLLAVPPDLATAAADLAPAPPSGIGTPCTSAGGGFSQGSCTDGQLCIPDGSFGFVDGYCTEKCSGPGTCPSDASCVQVMQGLSLCFLQCATDHDCRGGTDYVCDPASGTCLPASQGDGVRPGTNDGGACVTPIASPPDGGGLFSANEKMSNGFFSAETELAVDPASKHVVTSWIAVDQTGRSKIGVATSTMDGLGFALPELLPKNNLVDMNGDQSDPVVAVDPMGNFYVTWIGFDRTNGGAGVKNMTIYVARSTTGGVSFDDLFVASPPGEWASGGQLDKPWIAASPVDGALYATWERAASQTTPIELRMARSTDQGQTWSMPITVNDVGARPNADRNLCQITVGSDGKPVAAWVEIGQQMFGSTQNHVYLQRFGSDGSKVGGNALVTGGSDSPAFEDPSVASAGGNVYVGFVSGDAKGHWDVRVAASLDGGVTFSPSVKVNDDPTCATHFHHQIAVDDHGNLHAIWLDNRYLAGNVFHASSGPADGTHPLAFGRSDFVNDQSFHFTTSRANTDWLGDYLGLTSAGGKLYAVWTDPRSAGVSQIFFATAPAY